MQVQSQIQTQAPGLARVVSPRLAAALLLSIAFHLVGGSLLEMEPGEVPDHPPLTAELPSLPPPPLPQAAPKPTPKETPPPREATPAAPAADFSPPPSSPQELPAQVEDPPHGFPEAEPYSDASPVLAAEDFKSPEPPLPPKIDLVYTVLYGSIGLHVGESSYRFEHAAGRFRIETVGEAQGLLALIYRGKLRASSHGRITATGLQPEEVVIERGGADKREAARLDWDKQVVTFKDDSSTALPPGTLDLLSFLLQFYFVAPDQAGLELPIVTPRRITNYRFVRKGIDRVSIALGDFDAEVWSRTAVDDSEAEALIWLAPTVGNIPIKIRVRDPQRGTGELRLTRILAEAKGASP